MTFSDDPNITVSTEWLAERLEDSEICVLDSTWFLSGDRDARAEYAAAHIPGAIFFDIDANSDPDSDLPHMAPSAADFTAILQRLGIGAGQQIVVYDNSPLRSSARVWWLLRFMGLKAAVLDGGFAKWQAEGRPVTDAASLPPERAAPTPDPRPGLISDRLRVAAGGAQVVDARAAARFHGEATEPRPGLRSGHIPGSLNIPFGQVLNDDGTLKNNAALREIFAAVDPSRPVITTCGSGVTAAVLFLALARLGYSDLSLYDGSWAEWGSFPDLPISTKEA